MVKSFILTLQFVRFIELQRFNWLSHEDKGVILRRSLPHDKEFNLHSVQVLRFWDKTLYENNLC